MTDGSQRRCAVVLCGGAGSRLGGVDKPLEHWRGKPLIDHVLARLKPQVDELCISANRNLEQYRQRAAVVMDDPLPTSDREAGSEHPQLAERRDQGPLAGVLAAARWFANGRADQALRNSWLLVCPGDGPLLPLDLGKQLAAAAAPLVCVDDGVRLQPLHALARLDVAMSIAPYLQRGSRSVRGWLDSQRAQTVLIATPDAFRNLNTPADFEEPGP